MPGYKRHHQFEGLGEFRDTIDHLAEASNHPVFADLGDAYSVDADDVDPQELQRLRHQAIWNKRDDELAYIGTDAYEITQHKELLGVIDDAVGQTVGEIDIGRIRDYGDRIDGMLTLDGHNVDVGALTDGGYVPPEGELLEDRTADVADAKDADGTVRDILGVGIRFGNSFDASERINVETMGYRFICQNWMVWGEETIGEFTQLHVSELNPEDIEELIFDIIDKKEDVESLVIESIDDKLKWSWVAPFLDDAGFGTQYQRKIIRKLREYDSDRDELRRWDVYNAVTDVLDNGVMVAGDDGVNPNVYDRHQGRAQYVLNNEVTSPGEEVPLDELLNEEELEA